MYIQKISAFKYKIFLSNKDMHTLDIDYNKLNTNNIYNKISVTKLLNLLKDKYKNINIPDGKLKVEVFPMLNNGFIFHITINKKVINETKKYNFIILTTKSVNTLLSVVEQIKANTMHLNFNSQLYIANNTYYMLLYLKNHNINFILHISNEYFIDIYEYNKFPTFLIEHCKCIINNNAIKKI